MTHRKLNPTLLKIFSEIFRTMFALTGKPGENKCPQYLLDLMEYKLNNEKNGRN